MKPSTGDAARILIVDDDPRIRQMLLRYFEQEGYLARAAENGAAMREHLASSEVDLIMLDIVMPGEDGLSLAREIRARSDVGIIMLTDRVVGLEMGADDYIAKPFHLREVLARVKSVLRRKTPPPRPESGDQTFRFEGWELDPGRRRLLSPTGDEVALTTGEFDLLMALVKSSGRVLGREALLDITRGRNIEAFDRAIDAQIVRLRKKIEADPRKPALIKSVRGVGYVFTGKVDR
jgi:two-component system OmpR family response regulator